MGLETQQFSSSDNKKPADTGEFDENILPKGAVLQSRYEIIKVLGVGGMGAVYLAQDLRFTGVTRMCAVKEMISTTPDPHVRRLAVQSFEREEAFDQDHLELLKIHYLQYQPDYHSHRHGSR